MYRYTVKPGENLWSISEDFRVSFQELVEVNQIADPAMIQAGQMLLIPGLPDNSQIPYWIQVSISGRNLTLFRNDEEVRVYPIAVGRILHATPTGNFIIINKAPNPGGPFGTMWMSLSRKHYGIHGTNDPSSIGKAVSRGCIRMYNEDVEELASTIPIGTSVVIRP
ncbi:L,D-transpeptidase [Salipaludibacillus neizhouensis]|uniref:L,D-transpeptidase n=1 Tax=Salipaludibacillus neizhouensis TaxID=885475 RepID=A0A3A9K860_9BACI|nr:L,D-transpeptidase family protein [Salipaludibacillus neizhouensis]RKL67688.1 L,D-transpeptidase [Salipaludibacillus neizhouensis]